jgi:ceramide glucosyltransferase
LLIVAAILVAIPPLDGGACLTGNLVELWRYELRWAWTLRVVRPWGYLGKVVTNPQPLALFGAWSSGFGWFGAVDVAGALACRLVLQRQVDHTLRVSTSRWWLVAARDLLALAVYVASFFVDVVSLRGRRYRARADGTLVPVLESKA